MKTGRRVITLAFLTLITTNSSPATWIADPGTVKVLVQKKPAFRSTEGIPLDLLDRELKNLGAKLVDDQDSFLLLQVPSASASPKILADFWSAPHLA